MTECVAIAVSGGIDSLVAAYLLKQQGADVFGVHFQTGFENPAGPGFEAIRHSCRQLEMDVVVVDLQAAFKRRVVDYFAAAYQKGETPNPCLVCNPAIKFDELFSASRQLGATRLATGHYARVKGSGNGRWQLQKGVDSKKDQSYFLARLTQEQLARACFPLGSWTKQQVKALAMEKGLRPVYRKESQDVCFIRDSSYADFITRITGIFEEPGDIVDTAGKRVGTHKGLHRFTIGQRRGINCPASKAYYVVRIDVPNNRLVVGFKEELYTESCRVRDVNWISDIPIDRTPVDTRIRYRHRAAASMVSSIGDKEALVRFDQPQAAVTPGQGAVFYQKDEVLGGGWIR